MKIFKIIISALLAISFSAKADEKQQEIFFYNEQVKKAFLKSDSEMQKKKPALQMFKSASGKEGKKKDGVAGAQIKIAENCDDYIKLSGEGFEVKDYNAKKNEGDEYGICLMLEYLKKAEKFEEDYWQKDLPEEIYNYFDIRKIYSSLLSKTRKSTLKNIVATDENFKVSLGKSIKINYSGENPWYYQFNPIAKADFDDDGAADILLEFKDKSVGKSSYYDSKIFILTKESSRAEIIPLIEEKKKDEDKKEGKN